MLAKAVAVEGAFFCNRCVRSVTYETAFEYQNEAKIP